MWLNFNCESRGMVRETRTMAGGNNKLKLALQSDSKLTMLQTEKLSPQPQVLLALGLMN